MITPTEAPTYIRRWTVRQGTSTAVVRADDIAGAIARAAEIGFDDPDSIVLVTAHA